MRLFLDLIKSVNKKTLDIKPFEIEIRVIDDKSKKLELTKKFNLEKQTDIIKFVEEQQKKEKSCFMTFNPFDTDNKNIKDENILNLNFVFIDIDFKEETEEQRINLVNEFELYLTQKEINFCYKAKGRGGFHYLIAINLQNVEDNKSKIKQFITNLNKKFNTNVFDVATSNPSRLIRIGNTYNFKEEKPILNEIVEINNLYLNDDIKTNTDFFKNIELEKPKITEFQNTNLSYENKKYVKDLFFTNLIKDFYGSTEQLNKASERNNIFLKNLGAFLSQNKDFFNIYINFITHWDKERIGALNGWIKKATDNNFEVNYFELKDWAKTYNLNFFFDLLKEQFKKNKNINYTNKDYNNALEILNKQDPLKYVLDVLKKKHIGEEHILLLLLISGISSGLKDRTKLIHCMGVGASGKGKTNACEVVGKVFNNFDLVISASPKNIFYKADKKILTDNGIIFFPESDTKNEEFLALERVLTDDKDIIPKHETVLSGKPKSLEITQINSMWRNSVSTSNDEDNQLNNRYYIFNVDETEEQDKNIFNHILETYNYSQSTEEEEINICKCITDIIKEEPKKVLIPYIRGIELTNTEDRRTLNKFLRLITSITYFYRHQRINTDNGFILSELKDFNIANIIWEKINKYESSKVAEVESCIIQEVSKHKNGIVFKKLAENLKKDKGNLSKKIKEMEQNGLLFSEDVGTSFYDEYTKKKIFKREKIIYSSIKPDKKFKYNGYIYEKKEGVVKGVVPLLYRCCTEQDFIKMALKDLERANIKELRFLNEGCCIFLKSERQEDQNKIISKIFTNECVSHFCNLYNNYNINNNNNILYNTLDTDLSQNSKNLTDTTTDTTTVQQQYNTVQQPLKQEIDPIEQLNRGVDFN